MATLHSQLKKHFRKRINAMEAGEKFPTEEELCSEFAVSRMTVNKVVRELSAEGLLVRYRRRGTFVSDGSQRTGLTQSLGDPKQGKLVSEWLDHGTPVASVFSMRAQTLRIHADECVYSFRREMWNRILARVERELRGVKLELVTDPAAAEECDLVLSAVHQPQAKEISTSRAAREATAERCSRPAYLSAAWAGITNHNLAACPFAVSTDLYVWNTELLQQHCPTFNGKLPRRLIEFVMQTCDWQAAEFPPVASFIFYPLIQWATEGIRFFSRDFKTVTFKDRRIKEYLEFNRHMGSRVREICGDKPLMNISTMWELFQNDRLLALNAYSSHLAVIDPARSHQYMIHTPMVDEHVVIVPIYLGIGRNCQHIDLAADVIQLICGEVGQSLLAENRGNIPALRTAATCDAFLSRMPQNMASVVHSIDTGESLLDKHPFFIIEQPYFAAFSRYILGEIDYSTLYDIIHTKES